MVGANFQLVNQGTAGACGVTHKKYVNAKIYRIMSEEIKLGIRISEKERESGKTKRGRGRRKMREERELEGVKDGVSGKMKKERGREGENGLAF